MLENKIPLGFAFKMNVMGYMSDVAQMKCFEEKGKLHKCVVFICWMNGTTKVSWKVAMWKGPLNNIR